MKAKLEKLIHVSSQNLPLPFRIGKKHPNPYRAIKSYLKPATTIQKQQQLYWTGKNNLEQANPIDQHLNEGRTLKINPHVTPEPTINV